MATLPELDALCGENFVYRDLIECGATWTRLAATATISNRPQVPATYGAMRNLCTEILDPIVRSLGRPILTYAFASRALTRRVSGGIAPDLDQHAGHEVNAMNSPVCARLGFAADFHVADVGSDRVARWICEHATFDRLYYYGSERPIHVSVAPQSLRSPVGQIVVMSTSTTGRRVPRVMGRDAFLGRV